MGKRKLVIFDFDGVIVDSLEVHKRCYAKVFAFFGKKFTVKTARGWKRWYDSNWENNYLHGGFSKSELGKLKGQYWKYCDYSNSNARFFPSVVEALEKLAGKYQLAIVSSTPDRLIADKLREEGLDRCFKIILGDHGASEKKTKLLKALHAAGAKAGQSIMVGDTETDILHAKSLGLKTIGVAYGWYSPARIRKAKPDAIAQNPGDIPRLVEKLLGAPAGTVH